MNAATAQTESRLTAVFAWLAVVGNVAGVAVLYEVPHAYKVEHIAEWYAEALASPVASEASAWAFTLGVALLVPFVFGLARGPGRGNATVRAGAWLAAVGALLNAAGTLAPAAVVRALSDPAQQPVAHALLWFTTGLDASFNLLWGAGLVLISVGLWRQPAWPRYLKVLGLLAGLFSLPVGLQAFSDTFARLLAISGPLWLVWLTAAGIRLWRVPVPLAALSARETG